MKKTGILLAAMALLLGGCAAKEETAVQEPAVAVQETNEPEQTPEPAVTESKTLLIYFSRAGENWEVGVVEKGNTRIAAEYIAEATGADVYEIIPAVPYPSDYMETVALAEEEKSAGARPEIASAPENWDSYDTVILGYPIWHGDLPMIVYTFLESYDFTGKTVYPFNTHGGSGLAGTPDKIRNTIPAADVKDGLALTGKIVQNDFAQIQGDIDAWLQKNNLSK